MTQLIAVLERVAGGSLSICDAAEELVAYSHRCTSCVPSEERPTPIPAGVSVSSNARIGPVLLLHLRRLEVDAGASVAFGNVFRGLDLLRLGQSATIGSWNWVSAAAVFAPYKSEVGEGALVVGASAAISSRHYLDCTGGITVGRMSTLAGARSTWFTHRINLRGRCSSQQGRASETIAL